MSSRSLAASLALAIALASGLAGVAPAQEKTKAGQATTRGNDATGDEKAGATKDNDKDKPDEAKPGEPKEGDKEKDKGKEPKVKLEKATFAGGCFWCLEAVFERIPGVKTVVSGYTGGNVPRPSYEMVCSGLTGHAEAVQMVYDAEIVSYEKLLQVFWICHDPTTLNRQGPDFGTQYRSAIFYQSEDQKKAALKSYKELTAAHAFADPIVTDLVPAQPFYLAERHHQDYYRRNRNAAYCQMEIVPKLRKLHLIK